MGESDGKCGEMWVLLWFTMVYYGLLGFTLVWFTMVYHGLAGFPMVWFTMVYYGLLSMVYYGVFGIGSFAIS